jgi:pimeloyl-ACP methyl ester carboxylesterase
VAGRRRALAIATLIASLAGPAACSDDPEASPPAGSRAVEVPGPDGSRLAGRELGRGPVALVLAHGATTDMSSWYAPMDELADAGYRVVAFDARGVGDSTGNASTDPGARVADIEAVIRSVRTGGADRVVVMGSSLGAQAALLVAERGTGDDAAVDAAVDAVVGVSPATVPVGAGSIRVPAFFVASEDDRGPAADARALARELDAEVEIVPGSVHGSDLFAEHPEATRALVAFLTKAAPASSS